MQKKQITIIALILFIVLGCYVVFYKRKSLVATQAPIQAEPLLTKEKVNTAKKFSKESLLGTWESNDDRKNILIFTSDGMWKEEYEAKIVTIGNWVILDSFENQVLPEILQGYKDVDGTFLKKTDSDGEVYYYDITGVSDTSLWLTYLARGSSLHYSKINKK